MASHSTVSMRIPRQARESAAWVAEQTGESVMAVIARAVKQAEDALFYQKLATASARTFDGSTNETDYPHENEPWMRADLDSSDLSDIVNEPEEKFWR